MADLVIKINGDIKDFQSALENVKKKTEDLGDALEGVAKTAGIAWAAFTGEILLAGKAFLDSKRGVNEMTQTLQNQGIYTRALIEDYKKYADELQDVTGIDNDKILASINVIQASIGQTKVTKELTEAIVNLSAGKKMDLETTANLIGKGINGHVAALEKLGIHVEEGLTQQERTARILEVVKVKYGDAAAAAATGSGGIGKLTSAIGDLQKKIGEQFAPIIEAVIQKMTAFFKTVGENQTLVNMIVIFLGAGAALAGLVTIAATAGIVWLKLQAILAAASLTIGGIASVALGPIAALGALLAGAIALYVYWDQVWPRIKTIYMAALTGMAEAGQGFGTILHGVFTMNFDEVKKGALDMKNAVVNAYNNASKELKPIETPEDKQNKDKGALGDKEQKLREERQARELAALKAHQELVLAEASGASDQMVAIKKREAELLDKIADEKYAKVREKLEVQYQELLALDQQEQEKQRAQEFEYAQLHLESMKEFQDLDNAQRELFRISYQKQLQSQLETEKSTRMLAANEKAKRQIEENNLFLKNQQEFGTAYATIYKMMHSEVMTGAKTAFTEMAAFQQSSNATLKGIGKAAAVANIIISTAESAMNIYRGFSAIPFIGPALGVAGAAAAIAFGAEQIGRVTAAAQGGLITGGIPGVDSVPVLAQHGELVAPAQNFDEVIGSVRAAREADKVRESGDASGGVATVVLELKDGLVEFIEAKIIERQRIGVSLLPQL